MSASQFSPLKILKARESSDRRSLGLGENGHKVEVLHYPYCKAVNSLQLFNVDCQILGTCSRRVL